METQDIKRIMIIDDDEEDREFFCYALNINYPAITVIEAIDGEHGMKVLEETSELPSCILLDLNMPRINGIEFLKLIKGMDDLKDIPIVIYTTSKLKYDQDRTLKLGAVDFVSKPDNLNDMQKAILHVVSRGWETVHVA